MNMRNIIIYALLIIGCLVACQQQTQQEPTITPAPESFIRIDGQNLILPNGSKFLIKGTNLGNWLNPEGYMFGFNKTNSPGRINQMLCEMVGPDFVAEFWKQFKDNYITRTSSSLLPQAQTPYACRSTINCSRMKTIWD